MTNRLILAWGCVALAAMGSTACKLKKTEPAPAASASAASTLGSKFGSAMPSAAPSATASASAAPSNKGTFAGTYTWSDGEQSGTATVTEEPGKVTIQYGVGTASCKVDKADPEKLTCSWWESGGAAGGANLKKQPDGKITGNWYDSDGDNGPFTFIPKT